MVYNPFRENLWQILVDIVQDADAEGGYFTFSNATLRNIYEHRHHVSLDKGTLGTVLRMWVSEGYIEVTRINDNGQKIYHKNQALPLFYPKIPQGTYNLWRTMRMLKKFTTKDLAQQSNISFETTKTFISRLKDVGYLSMTTQETKQGEKGIFRLIRDTGQLPPKLNKNGTVADRNNGETYAK